MTTRPRTNAAPTPKKVDAPKKATQKKAAAPKATAAEKTTAAKKPTRDRATTKTPVQLRRLPEALRITGEVLMDRPAQPGGHAHRRHLVTDLASGGIGSPVHGALTTACRPLTGDQPPRPYAQFSAGWADHFYQAIACPDCFPDATPAPQEVTP